MYIKYVGITLENISNYFIINKRLVEQNDYIQFNLYTVDLGKKQIKLIYNKGNSLSSEESQDLLTNGKIFAHKSNEDFYNRYYKHNLETKFIPKDMKGYYLNVGKNINTIFKNPGSLENVKKTKEVVDEIINIIVNDTFTVSSFVTIMSYDYLSHTHALNVSVYSMCLGHHLGMKKETLVNLGTSALLHDLGKTKVDQSIINKKGKLTQREFHEVKQHPHYGWLLAKQQGINNKDILAGIKYHHEKIDGTGYPEGLKDKNIPLFARIIGICDAFDALTTNRSYQTSLSSFDTLITMKKEMSNQFDKLLVNKFIEMLRDD